MSNTFIGRKKELDDLNSYLNKKTASLIVVKGRRRIGKSRLLDEFSKNKRSYKFIGLPPQSNRTKQDQLDEFSRQLSVVLDFPEIKVDNWSKLFILLNDKVKTEQVILIFDEISWMGSEDPDFLGKLKTAWDELFKKNPKLMLIFCGSVSTWIDDNILNSKAFYGRISWILDLEPLPLSDCNKFLKNQGFRGSNYEKFKILSITGGIPWYLEQIQGDYSADDNIKRQCFTKGAVLVDEFERIFHEIFGKRDKIYKKIVKVLANGPCDYDEIVEKSKYKSSGRFSEYLTDLTKAGFISRDYTWSLKSGRESRTSKFRLRDNYLRFYLKYIDPRLNQINKGRYKDIALSSLSGWDSIMGLQFENLALDNRSKILKHLHIRAEDIIADNPYLQRQTSTQKGCQIDYLIQTKYKNLYPCEVKFSRNLITSKVIEEVKTKIDRLSLPRNAAALPVLIHVNGVSESVIGNDYFYKIIDFAELLTDKS
ncbi:MAG: hypothetical protein KR126chlam5_00136 [Candidatus Anoxychlamydiales bacterium]|nr:hypothetical protein [Candidatus Anoxychlamydiales bacterium]